MLRDQLIEQRSLETGDERSIGSLAILQPAGEQPLPIQRCLLILKLPGQPVALGERDRRIELNERLALLHFLPIAHVDRTYLTRRERLNDLDAIAGNHLARRDRNDIDVAEAGPCDCSDDDRGQAPHHGAPKRVRRCLLDLQRGRQERGLVALAGKRFIGPVILNETAARMLGFATSQSAIGQVIRQPPGRYNTGVTSEVVGVVTDFPVGSLRGPIDPVVFFTDAAFFDIVSVKLDGRQIPETLAAIDRLWKQLGEPRPINRWFADEFLQDVYREDLRQGQMAAVSAGIAVFIACLGLFGLAAFTAERRTKEIGVRKALGASRTDIVRLLLWQFTRPVLWANLIAWPVGWYAMHRWLERFAYRTDIELWMLLGASTLAVVIALATVATHAIVVARARPVTALRYA